METHTGLSSKDREALAEGLSRFLANTYALYLKAQNFHWNLIGFEFYALHLLFEKQYEDLGAATDEIAERIRALGFYVDASFSGFQKNAEIRSEKKGLSAKEMLQHLLEGHELIIREGRKLAALAEKKSDAATVDMMGRRLGAHEKAAWMLRSSLS